MTVDRCIRFHRGVFSVRICRRVKTVKDARVLVNWIRENFTDGNNCEFYEDTKRNEQIVQTFKAFRTYREAKKFRDKLEAGLRDRKVRLAKSFH